jgi:hypothetical protein
MPGRSTLMNIGSRLGLSLIDLRFHRVHDSHTKRYIVTNLAQCPSFLGEPRAQLFLRAYEICLPSAGLSPPSLDRSGLKRAPVEVVPFSCAGPN